MLIYFKLLSLMLISGLSLIILSRWVCGCLNYKIDESDFWFKLINSEVSVAISDNGVLSVA